jgi:UDP-3-O-[3-hydroxymyristoyl] N-acetylglucosamine deacetylase / 3-hydroxyacyl-[acyl-carrier-protein] dehydratase
MSILIKERLQILFEKVVKQTVYDAQEVAERLPHAYPFLLVDKIVELGQQYIVGVKNVTWNEWYFQGHFKDEPVMPGVLILEGMMQTGGILSLERIPGSTVKGNYVLKIGEAKFKGIVKPGDTIYYYMELGEDLRRGMYFLKGEAYVDDKKVAEADFTLFNKNLQGSSIKLF